MLSLDDEDCLLIRERKRDWRRAKEDREELASLLWRERKEDEGVYSVAGLIGFLGLDSGVPVTSQ